MFGNLIIHGLALGAQPKTADDIARMTERALNLGACGIELVFWPGPNNINAREAAHAITKVGGMRASVCVFHPHDENHGDPLSSNPASQTAALEHVRKAICYADGMRQNGLRITTVDGPWAFTLGKTDYDVESGSRLVTFAQRAAEYASLHKINLALERLQHSEDGVIRHALILADIIKRIDSPYVGAHDDSFHAEKNGMRAHDSVRTLGKRLMHYHANGLGNDVTFDGRIPCGCSNYRAGSKMYNDRINWREVSLALAELRQSMDSILICLEPFSEAACAAIPPLRNGVVPVTDDAQIRDSVRHLMEVGMLQRV